MKPQAVAAKAKNNYLRASKAILLAATALIAIGLTNKSHAATFTQQELAYMPATEQIELFKQGVISPVDVLKAQIAEYNKTNKEVNATTYTYFDAAMKQAKIAEQKYKDGTYRPLEGITVGVKDEHHDKGWKVSMGSSIHKNDAPKDFADPVVSKLKAAGAILSLQTTVPELYLNYTTDTRAWGTTKNPWNLKYTVGGSSGGSGAALAAGYVTIATGSDMGGSVRIPASVNGLYGYKSVYGEIHTDMPLATFSGTGPLARSFDDMVLMQNIIAGPGKYSPSVFAAKPLPMNYPSIKGMKIAYVGGMGIAEPTKEVNKAMQDAIARFQKLGATVDVINLDFGIDEKELESIFSKLALSGAMGGMFADYNAKTDKMTTYAAYFVKKSAEGEFGNKQLFEAEQAINNMYKQIVDQVFSKGYDIIIAPTMPTTHIPADHDFTKDKIKEDGIEYGKLVGGVYTLPFNLLNWMPVISVPAGLSSQDMPIGLQIIGKPYDTYSVFKAAGNYSKVGPKLYHGNKFPKQ